MNLGRSRWKKESRSRSTVSVCKFDDHRFTADVLNETVKRTGLGDLVPGAKVNLERALRAGDAMGGHIVQGHVDETAKCIGMEDADGSTYFTFQYKGNAEMARRGYFTVDKGSVTVNGVSLTVCEPTDNTFKVAIIPYTRQHTNFADIQVGSVVNIEFDILGKYIARLRHFDHEEVVK